MTPASKKWIEAAKILAVDPTAIVRCPERGDGVLRIHDELFAHDETMMERYLVCDTCGARNALRMKVGTVTRPPHR
jgi:hypothetical protein